MSYSDDAELDAQRHTDELEREENAVRQATQAFKRAFHIAAAKNDAMSLLLGEVVEGKKQPLFMTVAPMLGCPFIAKMVVEYILEKAKEDRKAWLIVDDLAIRYASIESQS